jgi:hypothetical protein
VDIYDADCRQVAWKLYAEGNGGNIPFVLGNHGWAGNTLALPLPPPLNGLYPTNPKTGRRHKSKDYRDWEKEAANWWHLQDHEAVPGMYVPTPDALWQLDMYVYMPTWAYGDLDGRFKAPIDFLCSLTELQDRHLTRVTAIRITDGVRRKGLVMVMRTNT